MEQLAVVLMILDDILKLVGMELKFRFAQQAPKRLND